FADGTGEVHKTPMRRRFCIVDAFIAGEGEGPVYATPAHLGAIIAGHSPVRVDVVASELAGFDFTKIPMLANAVQAHPIPLLSGRIEDRHIVGCEWTDISALRRASPFKLAPPRGWARHIEHASDLK